MKGGVCRGRIGGVGEADRCTDSAFFYRFVFQRERERLETGQEMWMQWMVAVCLCLLGGWMPIHKSYFPLIMFSRS